jgi:hypothetical protein
MPRGVFTLRIDTPEREALAALSKIEKRPMNQLLNEAIKAYLKRRGAHERGLETNLERLRAYRKRDPGFRKAIAAFAEAEVTHEDPLEGELVRGRIVDGQLEPVGPVLNRIRDVLGG